MFVLSVLDLELNYGCSVPQTCVDINIAPASVVY